MSNGQMYARNMKKKNSLMDFEASKRDSKCIEEKICFTVSWLLICE